VFFRKDRHRTSIGCDYIDPYIYTAVFSRVIVPVLGDGFDVDAWLLGLSHYGA
jgi:hypothetical protein